MINIIGQLSGIEGIKFSSVISDAFTYELKLTDGTVILVFNISDMVEMNIGDILRIPVKIETFNEKTRIKCIGKIINEKE